MGECLQLPGRALHHARRSVADRGDGDPAAQVDERVAVGIDDDAATGGLDEDRQRRPDTGRQRGELTLQQSPRARAGDLRADPAHLRQLRTADNPAGLFEGESHAISGSVGTAEGAATASQRGRLPGVDGRFGIASADIGPFRPLRSMPPQAHPEGASRGTSGRSTQ